jgi:hypothetical protein
MHEVCGMTTLLQRWLQASPLPHPDVLAKCVEEEESCKERSVEDKEE